MEKLSQTELLQDGFLDNIRAAGVRAGAAAVSAGSKAATAAKSAGSAIKKIGRGVANVADYANKLDREGFGVLKDPLKRFINSDPKAAFKQLMEKNYSRTFDIKTVQITNVAADQNAATPSLSGAPGTAASNVSGRTIITFIARQLITTGGSNAPATYTAVLSLTPERDPNNMFSMRVFDDKNREIQGSKEYIPKFDRIVVAFDKKYPNSNVGSGTLSKSDAEKLIDMVYTTNSLVFDNNEKAKFSNLLAPATVNISDIKIELTRQRLVEKVKVSQKVLLEQLKNL